MKCRSIHIVWKKSKRVPKCIAFIWLILGLFSLFFLIQLFLPPYHSLDDLRELEIHIDNVHLFDSHDKKGSRLKLTIADGDNTYYLWYPQSGYKKYARAVETELLTGDTTLVTAKIVSSQTLRDKLLNRKRVVDLRSGDSVYYGLDTEKDRLSRNYASNWILFPLFFSCWVIDTLWAGIAYDIVIFRQK